MEVQAANQELSMQAISSSPIRGQFSKSRLKNTISLISLHLMCLKGKNNSSSLTPKVLNHKLDK